MTRRIDIRLLRHPQKVFGTGELTPSGIKAFKTYLLRESAQDYSQILVYLTPHPKRGRPLLPIARSIIRPVNSFGKPSICTELYGRFSEFTPADVQATMRAILQRKPVQAEQNESSGLYEPWTEEEEALLTSTGVNKFWDIPFPGPTGLSGMDIALEIQNVVDFLISNMNRFPVDSKILVLAISHSGIVEQFIKLVYLMNNPDKVAQQVTVEDVGGLIDFLDGPTVKISKPPFEHPSMRLVYKNLLLPYKTRSKGKMTLEQ